MKAVGITRRTLVALAGAVALSTVAPAAAQAEDYTIPIIVKDTTSFYWQIVLAGARKAGTDLGVNVPELGAQSEADINGQISIIENAVSSGANALVVAPTEFKALGKPIDEAAKSVPVIGIDSAADSKAFTSFLTTDNVQGGRIAADGLAAAIGAANGGKVEGDVALITNLPGAGSLEQRAQGFKEQLAAKLQILEEQLAQRRQELAELKSRLGELNRTYGLLNKELSMTRPLVAQGAVSEVEVLRLQRQASEMSGNIQTTKIAIPKVESKITEAKKALEEERLIFHNTARKELNEAYGRLEGITASAVALADRLERTAVRSPVRGTINQIKVNTVGGTIQPGMDLIEIVPLEDTLLVEARIKPADIAFLHPAQQAVVKFTAYDFTIYGGLDADLEHISADSITDKQGNDYYLVRLRTRQNSLGSKEKPLPIIPGMVVSVDILTGKKTILTYLLKPVLRARHMALRER